METINDVLHFLNRTDVIGILTGNEFNNNIKCEEISTEDFKEIDLFKLAELHGIIDDLHLLFIGRNRINYPSLTSSLREKIFDTCEEKII